VLYGMTTKSCSLKVCCSKFYSEVLLVIALYYQTAEKYEKYASTRPVDGGPCHRFLKVVSMERAG
jgi:hypothetical protein